LNISFGEIIFDKYEQITMSQHFQWLHRVYVTR